MKGKLMFAAGSAVGYVLGTRQGRERYDQIKVQAERLWHRPEVQKAAVQAESYAKDKSPEIQQKLANVAATAMAAVKSRSTHGDHAAASAPTASEAEQTRPA